MTGLVIFLTGSVSEAAVLRARSVSLEKQADAEWHDGLFAGIKGKGANASVHGQGVTASVKDLLAGIEGPRGMSPEVDNMFHLLQATQKGTPMKDLLDIVNPEIDKMEKQILDAKTSAQHALDGIDVSFTKCKTNKRVGEGEADGLQSTMNGKRQPHKDCRGFESSDKIEYDSCGKTMDALKTTMNLACDEYNKAVKAPNVNLVPAQNGNEDYKLWLGRVKTWVDDELSSVTRKEAACNTAKSNYDNEKERCEGLSGDGGLKKAWEDKKTQCDEAQTAFETAACDYSSKVAATCSSYETCVAATETVYDNQRPHIESEEKDRETEFRAVQRIKCLLDVWGAQGDSVDKAKLQECMNKTHSTSHLELSYPTPPAVPLCALPERPCTTGFVSAEYGGLPAHAPHKACTPCAGAASTPACSSANVSSSSEFSTDSISKLLIRTVNSEQAFLMWTSGDNVHARLATIGGASLSLGPVTPSWQTSVRASYDPVIVPIDGTRIGLFSDGPDGILVALVVDCGSSTPVILSSTTIQSQHHSAQQISAEAIDSSRFLVASLFSDTSSCRAWVAIWKVTGDAFSEVSRQYVTERYSLYFVSVAVMSATRAVIAVMCQNCQNGDTSGSMGYDSAAPLGVVAQVVGISSNSISLTAWTSVAAPFSHGTRMAKANENTLVFSWRDDSSSTTMALGIVKDMSITMHGEVRSNQARRKIDFARVDDQRVALVYQVATPAQVAIATAKIDRVANTVVVEDEQKLADDTGPRSITYMSGTSLLVAWKGGYNSEPGEVAIVTECTGSST